MGNQVKTWTQGISDDWLTADGDYTTKLRGVLDGAQIESALNFLMVLDTPDGDDPCTPHVLIEGPSGQIGFIGQGDSIYCLESETEVSPQTGAALALGRINVADLSEPQVVTAPPPPVTPPRSTTPAQPKPEKQKPGPSRRQSKSRRLAGILGSAVGTALTGGVASGVEAGIGEALSGDDAPAASERSNRTTRAVGRVRKRLTWRQYVSFLFGGGFIVGGFVCVAGALSVADRGGSSDDIAFAAVLAAALILIGFVWIIASLRSAPRFDAQGNQVDASGNILMAVGMAHAMNMADDWGDDYGDAGMD